MKVSLYWLNQLTKLNLTQDKLIELINLRTIGTKEVTPEFIELDMKGYNRADLLSMRGVAREIAAITGSTVTFSDVSDHDYIWDGQNLPQVKARVENAELCPVYCVAKIENLQVGPSNEDWVKKLEQSGMRSINNITDVTNLIMLEYGQPLHAFDAANVKNEEIIVKLAKDGEEFVTLDGKKRLLSSEDLVIADPQKVIGIAGVMGGQDSEVKPTTKTILLEAAIFDPVNIRKTAQRLSLQSEASRRFQHGLTKTSLQQALNQAVKMYQDLGGKLTSIILIGDLKDKSKNIIVNSIKVQDLIGLKLDTAQMESYLKSLNFKTQKQGNDLKVTPPYYRLDVGIAADVIEEIARIYGYEKIPPQTLPGNPPTPIDQTLQNLTYDLGQQLTNLGLDEVKTYSFYSTKALSALKLDTDKLIKIANPISAETEYMKTLIWPGLTQVTAENLKFFDQVAIFETGQTYHKTADFQLFEKRVVSIAIADATDYPYQKLFSIIETAFKKVGKSAEFAKIEEREDKDWFHPTRYWTIKLDSKQVGFLTEVHPRIAFTLGTEKRVAVAEIDLNNTI